MAIPDDINRVLRDFERYTGDGKPYEPTGHPLPIGDPRSGVHHILKPSLRDVLIAIYEGFISEFGDNTDILDQITRNMIGDLQSDVDRVSSAPILQSQDPKALRAALGIDPARQTILAGPEPNLILDPLSFAPSIVYAAISSGTVTLDIASAMLYTPYQVINASPAGGDLILDVGDEYHFAGAGLLPGNVTTRQVTLAAGKSARFFKGNVTKFSIILEGETWYGYSGGRYRQADDGSWEFDISRAAGIAAGATATFDVPAGFSLAGAYVVSLAAQPHASGAAPSGPPPVVTKLGSNGLPVTQGELYNFAAALWNQPIRIRISNVTKVS